LGEDHAVEFLARKGYIIIERNYRTVGGEIDVIARDGETLVFVEVKVVGAYDLTELGRIIGRRKKNRIRETARWWLKENDADGRPARFDVVAVLPDGREPRHIEDAF